MTNETLIKALGGDSMVTLVIFKFEGDVKVRINSTSKKVKKFFNRKFGTGVKVSKALLKAGLKEGSQKIELSKFLEILDSIENKSRINRSLKFIKKAEVGSLDDIDWTELPSKCRRTRSAVKRYLMFLNYDFIKESGWNSVDEIVFSELPVQGMKEKEVIKYFD